MTPRARLAAALAVALTLTTHRADAQTVIEVEARMGPERPPAPVDTPLLTLADRDDLGRVACVAKVGAYRRQLLNVIDANKRPQRLMLLQLDDGALSALGWRLDGHVGASRSGVWISAAAVHKLGLQATERLPENLMTRVAIVGSGRNGPPHVDEALPLLGLIRGTQATGAGPSGAVAVTIADPLQPAGTRLSGNDRISAAVPPVMVLRSRGDAHACIAALTPLLQAWSLRTGLPMEARAHE